MERRVMKNPYINFSRSGVKLPSEKSAADKTTASKAEESASSESHVFSSSRSAASERFLLGSEIETKIDNFFERTSPSNAHLSFAKVVHQPEDQKHQSAALSRSAPWRRPNTCSECKLATIPALGARSSWQLCAQQCQQCGSPSKGASCAVSKSMRRRCAAADCDPAVPKIMQTKCSIEKNLTSQVAKPQKVSGPPFYATPPSKKTSAEIINEARAAVGLRVGMKAVSTKRPFTPRDKQRSLFGKNRGSQRPPSSISSLSLHVEEESGPWGIRLPLISQREAKHHKSRAQQPLSKLPLDSIKKNNSKPLESLSVGALIAESQKQAEGQSCANDDTSDEIQSLIKVMQILAADGGDAKEIEATLRKVYNACERAEMLGRRQTSNPTRAHLLQTLFLFVENDEQRVQMQVARILLGLQVMGSNLSAVCKLLFKVSRSDQNDKLFLEDNVLELLLERLGAASLLEDSEACVYGYGALKCITLEPRIVARVRELGGLALMVLHLKLTNLMAHEGSSVPEKVQPALFQLTGALRHMAGDQTGLPFLASCGAVAQLCRTLQLFPNDPDLVTNVVRTLSIASMDETCCDAIVAQQGSLKNFVFLLQKYPERQDLVVRLSYALGNLMARSEHARNQLLGEEGTRTAVLSVLERCYQEDQRGAASALHATEDVLVKVLRVVANASLSETVGPGLADSPEVLSAIHGVLTNQAASEELLLGALLTLNNLSFYPSAVESQLAEQQLVFAEDLLPLLAKDVPEPVTVEALRVFGNLSRWKDTRSFLLDQEGLSDRVVSLLSEGDQAIQYVAIGVLVNLLSDPDGRPALRNIGIISKLISLVQSQNNDWELASLTCQAVWNCLADISDLSKIMDEQQTDKLANTLADMLDEEKLFGVEEGQEVPEHVAKTFEYQMWDEFASVATNLLERLESFIDQNCN
ncbi:armadillo repeat-containing protein 2 [Neocloeon triangulifer]|uniref:armadillo repeat-containing protein 2 n=1 Tax=Neocloeon triangulifer TaxID=2078957 RepID=UPI00286EBD3F|nr:armadillo repeat-containing protein 2 [Neocloeon triangulifer]